jgi:hypothetical protein
MEKLFIKKNGVYNQLNQKVKLEHGNSDQIKALREYEKKKDLLINEGLELEVYENVRVPQSVKFFCACGKIVEKVCSSNEDGNYDGFINNTVKCYSCNATYNFKMIGGNNFGDFNLFVFLNEK